jgi:protein tyrosine phosphatase
MFGISKYVNASFIPTDSCNFIPCQLPKKQYIGLFNELIKKSKTSLIMSLIDLNDYDYLESFSSRESDVHLNYDGEDLFVDETFNLNGGTVRRLRFLNWEDFSVPKEEEFLQFYKFFSKIKSGFRNIIVHCKAGVGRTGVFIMHDILSSKEHTSAAEFTNALLYLRFHRPNMIFNDLQLEFLYRSFVEK